jgi:hypothetical protein
MNPRDPRQLRFTDTSSSKTDSDSEKMGFRELSNYLREFSTTFKYDSTTEEITELNYDSLGIQKLFEYKNNNLSKITIVGNLPKNVTETSMHFSYDTNDELIKTSFS